MKIKKIVMIDPKLNYGSSFGNTLEILDESDYATMDGFMAIQYGKQAILINKAHIVSIEPTSLERW
jgi:hypothetical protein